MKKYLVTFCIGLLMTIFACMFNAHRILFVSALGGVPLAAVAYWRMYVVDKAGLSLTGHTVAYMLGWLSIFFGVMLPLFDSTLGSLMVYISWGIAAIFGCTLYRFRRNMLVPGSVMLGVWILFVLLVVQFWADFISVA